MTSKERFITAIEGGIPDRLPVTTHHILPSYLNKYMSGKDEQDFFDTFYLDPIKWLVFHKPDESRNEFADPTQGKLGFLEGLRVCTDSWQFKTEPLSGYSYETIKFSIITPEKNLWMILQSNEHTTWVAEHLVKEKSDLDLIAKYMSSPSCDVELVNKTAAEYGQRGLIRSHVCCFDGFGQPGCWQDLACIFGIENLIFMAFEDPEWVKKFLGVLQNRKLHYIRSMKGAHFDIIELGGGDASTTVISPEFFEMFVAPFDSVLIEAAHLAGQRIVYHTCGGMMPILEQIASMKPDAMETFTPSSMGGDTNLNKAKKTIGDKVCMIGGFNQNQFLMHSTPEETRAEVRRCFAEAGENGAFILSPSDHFFDARDELINAYSDEARKCMYKK